MAIDWFPGHMVTARKAAIEAMQKTDVVIEVLDARVPHSSCNPLFETLRRENQRPALKLLNKADLADRERTEAWLREYNARPGTRAIALSGQKRGEAGRVVPECRLLAPGRGTAVKPLRMLILGVPNVGKSTLMNSLLGRRLAKIGDEPAITKTHQGHELEPGVWLVDTPGMTWPRLEHDVGIRLAATHSIGRNAYDADSVAIELGSYLLISYRTQIEARYGAGARTGDELLALIAKTRKLVARGSTPDLQKAAMLLLQDFREGTLGRMTLETVEQVAARGR